METTMTETTRHYSLTETAKLIRQALKDKYGKFPFSVRSKSYAGGCSITVYWTDGPTAKAVDAIVSRYAGAGFDGMTDYKYYLDPTTMIDQHGNAVHVTYGADYVFTQRSESRHEALKTEAAAYIRAHCTCEGTAPMDRFGNEWVDTLASRVVWNMDFFNNDTMETAFRKAVLREQL